MPNIKTVGNTIYEGDFTDVDNKIVCTCGNTEFKWKAHLDMNEKAVTCYNCTKCGRILSVTVKREMPW